MFRKINNFFKKIDEKILKGGDNAEPKAFNFKGQRIYEKPLGQGPTPTREQFEESFELDDAPRMQSRRLRLKNFGLLVTFISWYAAVMLFISYRLRSDDLETLEKEAETRIKLSKKLKNKDSHY